MRPRSPIRCISAGILFADVACWPIDHLPHEGELVPTERIGLSLGGNAANIALNLARLEIPVALSGCVGDDALSDFVAHAVDVPGVDITGLQRVSNNCPGTSLHINVTGQDRRFVSTTGANDLYVFDDYLAKLIDTPPEDDKPRVFSLSGILMLAALENEQTPLFLEKARAKGWKILLDVVLYGKRPYWDVIRPLLPHVDVFMPNELEAEKLSGKTDPTDQADFFLKHGATAVVITRGEQGAHYADARRNFHQPIFSLEFLSGAGSGDAFASGFIAAMLENLPPEECVRWGSALGASAVRGLGTNDTVFNRAELAEFLARH